jgi:hypothetical protein
MDPGPLDDESAHLAAAWSRDEQHALLLARTIQLAARTHPELLREALAGVFDVSGLLADGRRCQADLGVIRQHCRTGHDMLRDEFLRAQRQLEQIEKEIDGLRFVVEEARKIQRSLMKALATT